MISPFCEHAHAMCPTRLPHRLWQPRCKITESTYDSRAIREMPRTVRVRLIGPDAHTDTEFLLGGSNSDPPCTAGDLPERGGRL
jgi:hypothetical protein